MVLPLVNIIIAKIERFVKVFLLDPAVSFPYNGDIKMEEINMKPNCLGLDIGNVLVVGDTEKMKEDEYNLNRKPMEDSFEVVASLIAISKFKKENVFIVSACFPNMERKSRAWLNHQKFSELTGVPESNWYFVRHRSDKAPLCRALGINYFVDDKLDVLDGINAEVKGSKLFAFNPIKDLSLEQESYITIVNNFLELWTHLKV